MKTSQSTFKRQEAISGWLLIAPLTIGFLLFTVIPLGYAVYISFCEYDLNSFIPVGFNNYIKVFSEPMFLPSLGNAGLYCLSVPVGIALALITAACIKNAKVGSMFFRMVFYIPCLCSAVAITFVWQYMYQDTFGVFAQLGIHHKFLNDGNIMISMMIMGIWSGIGVNVLMYYATMHGISNSMYEAASIDGANGVQQFLHITLAGVSSVSFYVLMTGIIGASQVFTQFQVMKGDPNFATITPVWLIYIAKDSSSMGYGMASAMGIIFGLILLLITGIQFVVSKYWVNNDW